ncbi:hypothetical protein Barb4_01332 [Bacteroidales bacterium Barb4]|nr:hypothetical protein Barb4_01332 [Bacteroidales bacterium Barb4]
MLFLPCWFQSLSGSACRYKQPYSRKFHFKVKKKGGVTTVFSFFACENSLQPFCNNIRLAVTDSCLRLPIAVCGYRYRLSVTVGCYLLQIAAIGNR